MPTDCKYIRVGFTGTRDGLTQIQAFKLSHWIWDHYEVITQWRHGCCLGADTEGVILADKLLPLVCIISHPPQLLGFYSGIASAYSAIELPPKPYLDRNKDIVDACDWLVVCPKTIEESTRGGTWWTYRYARDSNKTTVIIQPDGGIKTMYSRD